MVLLKKAQVETVGLLVIVILLVFLALFAIKIISMPQSDNSNIKDSIIANNIVNAITKVTICEKQQLSSIVKACYSSSPICKQDSCSLLKDKLSLMMSSSGYKQNNYKMQIKTTDKELLSIGNCDASSNIITSSPYTIYLDGTSAILKVSLC